MLEYLVSVIACRKSRPPLVTRRLSEVWFFLQNCARAEPSVSLRH